MCSEKQSFRFCTRLFIVALLGLAASCHGEFSLNDQPASGEAVDVTSISWAVVDSSSISRALLDLANKQNPLSQGLQSDKNELQYKKNKVAKQIASLQYENRKRCLNEQGKELTNGLDKRGVLTNRALVGDRYYDAECIAGLPEDELITVLNKQLDEVNTSIRELNRYQGELSKAVREIVPRVVSDYSKGRYELVMERNTRIWYSSQGVTVDVTGALLKYLEENPPDIVLPR